MSEYERELLGLVRAYGSARVAHQAALNHLDAMTLLHKGENIDPRTAHNHPLYLAVIGRNKQTQEKDARLADLDAALLRGR